jgi:hypothetical protein
VSFLFGASWSFAAPHVVLHPVELLGYEGQDLRLKVLIPCGGEFYGIIAHEGPGRGLELAAAVLQKAIMCTGVPEPKSIKVGFLDVHRFDSIGAMVTGAPKRIEIKSLESLSLGRLDEQGADLVASSRGHCGVSLGALLKPSREGVLYLGLAGLMRRSGANDKGDQSQCATQVKETLIRVVSPTAIKRVRPLETIRSHITRQYELRIAQVDLKSLRTEDGKVHLRYLRDCREAPVGLVSRRFAGNKVEVGVLVAHYFNAPCGEPTRGEWVALETNGLAWSQGEKLQPVSVLKDNEKLSLKSLKAIDARGRLPTLGQNAVKVSYSSACGDIDEYVISSTTRLGDMALGVVTRTSLGRLLETELSTKRCSAHHRQKLLSFVTASPQKVYALQLPR